MRFLVPITLIIMLTSVLVYEPHSTNHDFSSILWEGDEVIFTQNVNIGARDNGKFNSIRANFTLLYLEDGKFTASIRAVIYYQDGTRESVTQEFIGSWLKQGRFVDMRVDDQHTVIMGHPEDEVLKRVNYYAKIALNQIYIISYYKGRLILVSSSGGPILTLLKKAS